MKGPTGCRYLDDARQAQYVQDGWNLTGDAYLLDDDGYFYYQARTDDMIISAGYNIAGPEVEDALLAHPAVAECARGRRARRRARPDRQGLRRAQARHAQPSGDLVQRAAGLRQADDRALQVPARRSSSATRLPRTETGKLQRFRLQDDAA